MMMIYILLLTNKQILHTHMIKKSIKFFSTVKSFGVIGAGQMGTGIAIVASTVAKIPVVIYDSNDISLKKSEQFVENWFQK